MVTAQYFVWFLSLLPLAAPSSDLAPPAAAVVLFAWVLAEAQWLYYAYLVEFEGRPVFLHLHSASVCFFLANVAAIAALVARHNYRPAAGKGGALLR